MPKDFDSSLLGFSVGPEGAAGYPEELTYTVEENVIKGNYSGVLYPGWGINSRVELPEEYFVNEGGNSVLWMILSIVFPILFSIASFLFGCFLEETTLLWKRWSFIRLKAIIVQESDFSIRAEYRMRILFRCWCTLQIKAI
jgi:hypothetical protein